MSWTVENYFAKAQAYWTRATSQGRDGEDFLLFVSLTIEFVARGGLCKVSPALNAALESESLLFAFGQTPRTPAKTIELTDGLKRLRRIIPELTDSEEKNIRTLVEARNGELHGDTAELKNLTPGILMPSVYSFFVKVAKFAGENLETLLGHEDAKLAQQTADAISKDRTKRVGDLIRICKERFFSLQPPEQKAKRDASTTTARSAVLKSGIHVIYSKCPACAQIGHLLASPVGRSTPFLKNGELVQEVRVIPIQFDCKCCDLKIEGLDELMAADFSHEYCSIDDVDPVDHFDINPNDYVDAETIAREYYSEMYDYQDE